MSRPRIEVQPNNVAGIRYKDRHYQDSSPVGAPHTVCLWQFRGVMRPTSSDSRYRFRAGRKTIPPSSPKCISTRSPLLKPACLAIGSGIRTARLFPHFATVVSFTIVSTLSIHRGMIWPPTPAGIPITETATTAAPETTLTALQVSVLGYLADGAPMAHITGAPNFTEIPSPTGAITTLTSPANS